MREQREEVVVPHLIEVLDNLDDDLDRIELWTAALSCFQHPAPEYQPDNVMSDEREGTTRSVLNQAEDQTVDVADQVAAEGSYGQARDSPSQVADAAGRSMKVARNTASSLGDVVRNTIEDRALHCCRYRVGARLAAWTHAPPFVECGRGLHPCDQVKRVFGLVRLYLVLAQERVGEKMANEQRGGSGNFANDPEKGGLRIGAKHSW